MSLIEIKRYLSQTKLSSLNGLAKYFHCDPELMRCMLSHLLRKGCVRKSAKTPACGKKCGQCSVLEYEVYEWIEDRSVVSLGVG